ncbi:hypothetical protein [Brachyspira innocens]|uniref:hypothetical protein n=1 Tax=Brachyspira innocens TaxID=13264 RepID=UPI0026EFFD7B|nr:hypothetical protein [Brachyspira innocens]
MREVIFIEDNGRFGITFKSDNKEEANTVMNAIQRFISKNSININEKKENIDNKDYSRCPIEGASKNVYWNLFPNDRLIEYYNNDTLEQGYKDYIKNELNKRGIFDLSMTKSKKKSDKNNNTKKEKKSNTIIENIKEHELNNKIENIKNGRDMTQLSNEELEEIALLESELASICGYLETAKHILQGRKFNHSRELENKITQGRRLSELTLEELEKLKEITMIESYKEDIQKEIAKKEINNERENKSFEETLKDNEIIDFGEDEEHSNYKIDEDPLSADTDNINNWDFDADGDKVDADGNKLLFAD